MPFTIYDPTTGGFKEVGSEEFKEYLKSTGYNYELETELKKAGPGVSMKRYLASTTTPEESLEAWRSSFGLGGKLFGSKEMAQFGFQMPQGWQFLYVPTTGKQALITPEFKEIGLEDVRVGATGEWIAPRITSRGWKVFEDTEEFVSPTGERFKIEDMQERFHEAGLMTTDLAWDYQAKMFRLATPETTLSSLLHELFPGVKDTETALSQMVITPDMSEEQKATAESAQDQFLSTIREMGRTPQAEELLKSFGATSEDISRIFGQVSVAEEQMPIAITEQGQQIQLPWWKQAWNAVYLGLRSGIHQTAQSLFTVLLPKLFPYIEAGELKKVPVTGVPGGPGVPTGIRYSEQEAAAINKFTEPLRAKFREVAISQQVKFDDWLKKHPELQPKPEYAQDPFEHPELFSDLGWWVNTMAETVGTMLPALVAGTAVTFATKHPILGALTTTAAMTPLEMQSLYDDLIASGAPEDKASDIALTIGAAIGAVEVGPSLIFMKAVYPVFKPFRQGLQRTVVKAVMRNMIAKGIINFTSIEVSESLEEVLQGAIHDYTVSFWDENRDVISQIPTNLIKALIGTLPFAIFGGGMSMRRVSPEIAQTTPDDEKVSEGWNFDPISQQWFKPSKLVDMYEEHYNNLISEGLTEELARLQALNEAARTLEGEQAIGDTVAKITQEAERTYGKPIFEMTPEELGKVVAARAIYEAGKARPAEVPTFPGETIPKPEVGMPEPGLQPSMIEEVAAKEVRPITIVKEALPNQVKQLHSELEADINIARKKIAEIKIPLPTQGADVQFARLALNDANKLIKRAETLTKRIEQGIAVSEEEINALRDKIASLKDYYKFEAKTTAEVKAKLVDYIKTQLPLPNQSELLAKVKNVKTEADLTEAIARVEELVEAQTETTLRADIIKELKKTAARIEKGITVGRLTPEVQPAIDKLRATLLVGIGKTGQGVTANVEAYEAARAKIEQGIVDYRDGKITWESLLEVNEELKYTGMYGMSSTQLQETLDYIQELKRLGKDFRKIKRDEIKAHRVEIVEKAVTEVTGGEGIKSGVGVLRPKDLAGIKKVLDQPVNSQYGLVNLLDKLGKFAKGTKMYQGFLMRFANLTQQAVNTENMERERTFKIVRDKFREIYNVAKTRDATRLLTNLSHEDVDLGTFKIITEVGVEYLPLKLTKAEMMEVYQLFKNPKNLKTFKEGMHWTPEIITKIVNTLSEQDIAWADWLQNEFYDTYYDKINPFYRQEFNIDMPKNPDYVPQSRDFDAGETDEVQMLLKDQKRYASVTNKSLKARQENIRPFQLKGVFTVLTNHIIQMEHFMAWAETMHELRSTFGNNEVRTAIRQYHSNDILRRIDDYMNDFARGGIDRLQFLRGLDKLRSNFAVSVLALKPSIGLQQIWTVGAFMTEMNVKDFVTGWANFWMHPIENYNWMMENSAYIKNRYSGGNYERDIRLAQQQGVAKTMSGAGNISQWLLWQVTQGDKFGVMPGWWAKYKAGLKSGLSQTDAMTEADSTSERTQNTSELASLSWLQRGSSWGKLLTMFQSQPNKYFRIIADNIRNMQYGRQSKVKGITNLFIVWVLLPMLFQFVADAFKFEKERQARLLVLGPLNNILVVGQLIQTAWGWFTDDSFDWQVSPMLSTVRDFQNFSSKLIKLVNQIKDPYEDVVMDDIVAAIEFFSKGIGQLLGLPTPYLIMIERAIRDGDPRELIFSRWALEEPTPDLQTKTSKLIGHLGQVIEDVTDLPVDKKPPIYDVKKVFSEVKKALSKTLLQDVTEKNGYSPQVVSIAQALMVQDILETLPNKRLYQIIDGIEADETLNYTFAQYYMDYQDRLKITSLAELKEWDAEHPRFYLGNVTPEQFQLMRQYEALQTKTERDDFLKANPGLNINPREEWLVNHPKENALLVLWGQTGVSSIEALNQIDALAKSLDIPDSARVERELDDITKLKLKNREYLDLLDVYGDLDDTVKDADGLTARDKAIADLKDKYPSAVDDMRRIEALGKGTKNSPTPENMVEAWVKRGNVIDEFGAGSSEAKVWLLDNPEAHKWALANGLLSDDGKDWKEPILRVNVQWASQFDRYESFGKQDSETYIADDTEREAARQRLLFTVLPTDRQGTLSEFGKAYYTKEASQAGYSESNWGSFVEYSALPGWGSWRERYLLDHPEFYREYTSAEIGKHPLIDETKVKPLKRDQIYSHFYNEYQEWDNIAGLTPEQVKAKHNKLLGVKKNGMSFLEAGYTVDAYDKNFPENLVDDYVYWYSNPALEKPERWDESLGWYEDDWWLLEHKDFYATMVAMDLWQKRDFSKVPTKEVFKLYQMYLKLGTAERLAFREDNPELDAWGVIAKGWTPIKGRRTGQIEGWRYSLAEEMTELEDKIAAMRKQWGR